MKKTLFLLYLSGTCLFANTLVGTWTIDEAKTKASLKASALQEEELIFTQRLVLHVLKSLECTANNTCIMTQMHKGNSSTGKYTYKAKEQGYILEGNNQQLIVTPTDNAGIKVLMPDISKEKLTLFYRKTSNHVSNRTTMPPKTVATNNIPVLKKMVSATTQLVPKKVSVSTKEHVANAEYKVKNKVQKTTHKKVSDTPEDHIVDIDIEKEKRLEKINADTEYWKAVQEVS